MLIRQSTKRLAAGARILLPAKDQILMVDRTEEYDSDGHVWTIQQDRRIHVICERGLVRSLDLKYLIENKD
jgi:hypothetical protein